MFYYELMEVSDFRNDVILAEACRGDVESFCKDVEPGAKGGRMRVCGVGRPCQRGVAGVDSAVR